MKTILRIGLIGLTALVLGGCAGEDDRYDRAVSIYDLRDGYAVYMDRRVHADFSLPQYLCIEFDESFDTLRYRLYNDDNRLLEIEGRYRIRDGDIELEIDGDGDDITDYIAVTSRYSDDLIIEGDYYDVIDAAEGNVTDYHIGRILPGRCYR